MEQITREALRIAHQNNLFIKAVNREFYEGTLGDTLTIRIPELYKPR